MIDPADRPPPGPPEENTGRGEASRGWREDAGSDDRAHRAAVAPGRGEEEIEPAPRRRRSLGVWALAAVNLALAACAFFFLRYLGGAGKYLANESADFGAQLQTAQAGIAVLRIASYVLIGGFLLSGLGVLSLTRIGRLLQILWAVLLCLTLGGLVYGLPVILLLLTRGMRRSFSPAPAEPPAD